MWGLRAQGRAVLLRPIQECELPLLVDWSAEADVLPFGDSGYHARTPAEVKRWWDQAGSSSRAFHWGLESEGHLAGHTAVHRIDWQSRNGWTVTAMGDRSTWRDRMASEAIGLSAEYAFRQLNLHKLKSSYVEGDRDSAEAHAHAGYRDVARLKEHVYRDGRWFDEIWTEVLRDDWERERSLT